MILAAQVQRALHAVARHHPHQGRAVARAGADIEEARVRRRRRGRLADRIAGQAAEAGELAWPAWSGALALVSITASNRVGRGGVPGERANREERRDDRVEPQRGRARRRSDAPPVRGGGSGPGAVTRRTSPAARGWRRRAAPRQRAARRCRRPRTRFGGGVVAAVLGQDLGAEPDLLAFAARERADRRVAVAAQPFEQAAFGGDAEMGLAMVDRFDQSDRVAGRASTSIPTAPCAGAGSMSSIAAPISCWPSRSSPAAASRVASASPRCELGEPGLRHCRGTARSRDRAGGARSCAARRGDEVPTRAPCGSASTLAAPISRSRDVGARQHRGDRAARRADGLDVLHRMDRKIGAAVEQAAVELLGPQAPCRRSRRAAGPGSCRRWW